MNGEKDGLAAAFEVCAELNGAFSKREYPYYNMFFGAYGQFGGYEYTPEYVERAVKMYGAGEKINIGRYLYKTDMGYRRAIDHFSGLNAWDLAVVPKDALNADEYAGSGFRRDYNAVGAFLSRFDYRSEFRLITRRLLQEGVCVCRTFYDERADKYTIQELPYGYLGLCAFTRDAWGIVPRLKDGDLSVSRDSGYWVFKAGDWDEPPTPYMSPAFVDLIYLPLFRSLQRDQNVAAAIKVLTAEITMIRDSKGPYLSDHTSVSKETIQSFVSGVNENVKRYFSNVNLPAENIKIQESTDTTKGAYEDFKRVAVANSGGSFFSSLEKKNVVDSQNLLDSDVRVMNALYPQFAAFLEFNANRCVKKYRFNLSFSGAATVYHEKTKRDFFSKDQAMGLWDINTAANAIGLNAFELEKGVEMTRGIGILGKLSILPNSNTQSMGDAGRPQADDNNITDSGASTRGAGSNIEKGGDV